MREAIRAEQRAVDATQGTERAAALEKLAKLRQELLGLLKSGGGGEREPELVLAQARAVVAGGGALGVPILTKVGAKILIVARPQRAGAEAPDPPLVPPSGRTGPTRSLAVLDLPALTTDRLDVLMRGDTTDGKTGGWLGAYNINYLPPGEIERRWPEWLAAIGDLGPQLWRLFGARLDAALKEHGVKPGARIIQGDWVNL